MIKRYDTKEIVWVDLENPSQAEVRSIMDEFGIYPLTAEEMLSPSLKPKIDLYDNYVYLIMHFPAVKHSHSNEENQEVDFVIGKKFLITARYDQIDPIHKFSKELEVSSILDNNNVEHAGMLFYRLVRKLYGSLEHELEYIESKILHIEEQMFEGKERAMVYDISIVSRNLVNFKQSLGSHSRVLKGLELAGKRLFDLNFDEYIRAIAQLHTNVEETLHGLSEVIFEVRETNNSLLTTKQNEAMKVLAIMAFVTFPLSLIASIFGMNTSYLPFVGQPNDFWIIFTIMAGLTVSFFVFFKYKKWL